MSASTNSFLKAAILSLNVFGWWDAYLGLRQHRVYKIAEVPAYFKDDVNDEEFAKAQAYEREKSSLGLLKRIGDLLLGNLHLLLRWPARLYYHTATITGLPIGSFRHNYAVAVVSDVITTALHIPFAYYSTFHVEARHGFNKTTKKEFLKDIIKSFALRLVILYPLQIRLIQFVVRTFGERFPLYLFTATTVLMLVFTVLYPVLILPLFNKFTKLDEALPLYGRIKELSASVGFPLKEVYVVDGSRRSHHSNAYLYGIGRSKRIVLYDTLLEQMKDDDECVVAVLCHELGHWQHRHTMVGMAIALTQLLALSCGAKAYIFDKDFYQAFGFAEVDPVIGFDLFSEVIYGPVSNLLGYVMCFVTRLMEFQADRFVVSQGRGESLRKALLIILKENRTRLTSDPLYAALHESHPPALERLPAIEAEIKKRS